MEAISLTHSILRWLVLIAGAASAVKFALASLRRAGATPSNRTLVVTFDRIDGRAGGAWFCRFPE